MDDLSITLAIETNPYHCPKCKSKAIKLGDIFAQPNVLVVIRYGKCKSCAFIWKETYAFTIAEPATAPVPTYFLEETI